MNISGKDIIVKYRYAIQMSDVYKPLQDVIHDWSKTKLDKIYQGKILLLVSPILRIKDSDDILVQVQIDVEGKYETLESLFTKCVNFIKLHKNMYFTYTGKTGFHVYSNYMYYIPNGMKLNIKQLREMILSKYDLNIIGYNNIDMISSIKDMPTIRIGYRPDTKRLAFPILQYNFDWFKSKMNSKSFINIMPIDMLKQFIRTTLIPYKHIRRI